MAGFEEEGLEGLLEEGHTVRPASKVAVAAAGSRSLAGSVVDVVFAALAAAVRDGDGDLLGAELMLSGVVDPMGWEELRRTARA